MNHIDKTRAEIKYYFDPKRLVKDSEESFESPNGKYRIESADYRQNKENLNWNVKKVEIYDTKSQEKIFDFFGNDDCFTFEWLNKDGIEFLICAEDIFGGQTVIDLTNKKMESYSPDEDGFIWTDFHLSPDGKTLATIGCFWACPYMIKIYDFRNPLILPLPELNEIELLDNDEIITDWLDNDTLQLKGIKIEQEMENLDDGNSIMKTIIEIPIEREIKALKQKS